MLAILFCNVVYVYIYIQDMGGVVLAYGRNILAIFIYIAGKFSNTNKIFVPSL